MTSRIDTAIPQMNTEIVRDRIVEILKAEIKRQAQLSGDYAEVQFLESVQVFDDRATAIDHTDMPAIEVGYFSSDCDNASHFNMRSTSTFYIDVYTKHHTVERGGIDRDGDSESSRFAMRLCGMIRFILTSPKWVFLGFEDSKFMEGPVKVRSITRNQNREAMDAQNISMYRIDIEVRCNEATTTNATGVAANRNTSTVKPDGDKSLEYAKVFN